MASTPEESKSTERQTPIPDIVGTQKQEKEKQAARKAQVTDKRPSLPESIVAPWPEGFTWHHQPHYLGGGGYGQANLWLAIDEEENIVERIVVKDCWLDAGTWRDINQWIGNPHNVNERKHKEIHYHRLLHPSTREDRQGNEYVARMFHAETFPEQMAYRMYLQYYAHRDLKDVHNRYDKAENEFKKAKAQARRSPRGKKRKAAEMEAEEKEEPKVQIVPEAFLWSVLEDLCRSCILLEHGSTDDASADPEWHSIVHRDIKLENIFLDAPSNDFYPSYPKAILADLGVAIQTFETDDRNPLDYIGWDSTENWQAPEMIPMLDRETFKISPVGRLDAHTNVWGIGGIIIALMNRSRSLQGVTISLYIEGESQPIINLGAQERYSETLRNLVTECTKYWPEERIGLQGLLGRIEAHTGVGKGKKKEGTGREDLARGMRSARHEEGDEELELMWEKNDPAEKTKFARQALDDLTEKK